jgi:hypothetical protein
MKLKHNKRRNTAFLYEALIKQLTKAALREDAVSKKEITKILKTFFKNGTLLKEELDLYRALYETKKVGEKEAEKILQEVKRVYSSLGRPQIFQTQSKLISQMNKSLEKSVFSNFVSNYKTIASISQIFDEKVPIKNKVLLERQIINSMIGKKINKEDVTKKLNSVELKLFSKRFNSTYNNLLKEQQILLRKFINSFQDNGLELKIYLNEELGRLRDKIKDSLSIKVVSEDSEMIQKTERVLEIIDSFKGQLINKNMLDKILKIQVLAKEIE